MKHRGRGDHQDPRERDRLDDGRERPPKDEHQTEEQRRKERQRKYRQEWARLNGRHRRVYTPWLLIRYRLADLGLRPIPAGDAHWQSPDIWVESSDPSGKAVAGEENFVHARVFNLGKAAGVPTRVDFYWADPSVGLGAAHMNLIGTEWVQVEPHTALDVRCDTAWVPVFVNNGHECLKVNCTNPILDPIAHPFDPRLDRHAGQRNITVLPAAAGETLLITLAVNNIFPMHVEAMITARVERMAVDRAAAKQLKPFDLVNRVAAHGGPRALGAQELPFLYRGGAPDHGRARRLAAFLDERAPDQAQALIRDVDADGKTLQGGAGLRATWTGESRLIRPSRPGAAPGNLLLAHDHLGRAGLASDVWRDVPVQQATLAAFEQRRLAVEIKVPADAAMGEFVAVHLHQRVMGMLVGGYTTVVQVTRRASQQKAG
jgi:hypothetical protein